MGQNFPENSQLFIFLGKCILLLCIAALVTRAVWNRIVANNPSIAKGKFHAE